MTHPLSQRSSRLTVLSPFLELKRRPDSLSSPDWRSIKGMACRTSQRPLSAAHVVGVGVVLEIHWVHGPSAGFLRPCTRSAEVGVNQGQRARAHTGITDTWFFFLGGGGITATQGTRRKSSKQIELGLCNCANYCNILSNDVTNLYPVCIFGDVCLQHFGSDSGATDPSISAQCI